MFSIGSADVACSSKKLPTVALSNTEAEYRGASVATCEAIWLRRLPQDLQIEVLTPILIYYDNINSMNLAKNLVFHTRTKHIEVHYHFVRERVLSGKVELRYVRTDEQIGDIFTKVLRLDKLQNFFEMLGIQHLDMPHLRGRTRTGKGTEEATGKKKNETGEVKGKKGAKSSEEVGTPEKVRTSNNGIVNSDKSWNGSETVDSVEQFDSEEPNPLKAKRTKG